MTKDKEYPFLTQKQGNVLRFIIAYQKEHGITPTCREIQGGLGYKWFNSAWQQLLSLERWGVIRLVKGRRRSITLVDREKAPEIIAQVIERLERGDIVKRDAIAMLKAALKSLC